MQANHRRVIVLVLAGLMLSACNLPSSGSNASPITSPTMYIMTLSALQTKAVMTATSQGISPGEIPTASTPAPVPVSGGTQAAPAGGTPAQGSVVINDTLCWRGPGPRYVTISAIFKGTMIQVLGRSLLPGWYIVLNPLYQDPCWAQASDIQLDPRVDVNALPVYAVPLLGTPTPPMTRTPRPATLTPAAPSATLPPRTPLPTLPVVPTPTGVAPSPTVSAPTPNPTSTPAPSLPPPPSATP